MKHKWSVKCSTRKGWTNTGLTNVALGEIPGRVHLLLYDRQTAMFCEPTCAEYTQMCEATTEIETHYILPILIDGTIDPA